MIKLVALDLDGTLLSSFGLLSPFAAQTLRDLRKKGIIVAISSGRPFYSVQNIIPDDCYDYASCMNGQDIYICSSGKHIVKPDLSEEEKKHLVSYLKKYRMLMNCAYDNTGHYLADEKHRSFVNLFSFMNALRHKLSRQKYYHQDADYDLTVIENKSIGKFCFCGYPATLRRFYHELDHDHYSCFFVNSSWLEIMHIGISKGKAVQEIMSLEHLHPEECAAFGDGENDIPMFEVCGTRVAMGNAMHSLKRHATDIARSYYEDGCAKWMKNHLL